MVEYKDIIIRFFRERLNNYELPVPPDSWAKIDKELNSNFLKFRRLLFYKYAGVAASILILLGIGVFFFSKREVDKNLHAFEKKIMETKPTENQSVEYLKKDEAPMLALSTKINSQKFRNTGSHKEDLKENEESSIAGESVVVDPQVMMEKDQLAEEKSTDKLLKPNESTETFKLPDEPDPWISIEKQKKVKNISYAVSMGNAGSGISSSSAVYNEESAYFYDFLTNSPNFSQAVDKKENIDYEYGFPMSFSFSIRKYLDENWALESGLTYNFLSSKETMKIPFQFVPTKDIALNYLGVPLKMVYSFYHTKRLSIYATGGGMIEKCVYGRVITTTANSKSTEKMDIPEIQWSILGSVGLNYQLVGRLGLFVEPGVGYYFDDKSEVMTVRKDTPFNFTLQGGLRLTY